MIELLIELYDHVLNDTNVHSHHVVEYFDAYDGQRQDSLWKEHLGDGVGI